MVILWWEYANLRHAIKYGSQHVKKIGPSIRSPALQNLHRRYVQGRTLPSIPVVHYTRTPWFHINQIYFTPVVHFKNKVLCMCGVSCWIGCNFSHNSIRLLLSARRLNRIRILLAAAPPGSQSSTKRYRQVDDASVCPPRNFAAIVGIALLWSVVFRASERLFSSKISFESDNERAAATYAYWVLFWKMSPKTSNWNNAR